MADLRPERSNFRAERPDLRPERPDLRPGRPDLRPERPDMSLRGLIGGGTNGRTDKRTKVPLCSTGHRPLRGRCPATHHLQSPTFIAGQRVSLTTYCPWATGFILKCVRLASTVFPLLGYSLAVLLPAFAVIRKKLLYMLCI